MNNDLIIEEFDVEESLNAQEERLAREYKVLKKEIMADFIKPKRILSKEDLLVDFRRIFKDLREKYDLTYEDLEKEINISAELLEQYETNAINIEVPYNEVKIIAKYFGIYPEQLMGWMKM